MYGKTSLAYRLAAFAGAGSVTAAILGGLAFIAQPTLPPADVAVMPEVVVVQEASAQAATTDTAAESGTAERLRVTVVGTRRMQLSATPVAQKKAQCPIAAHASFVRSLRQPSAESDKV